MLEKTLHSKMRFYNNGFLIDFLILDLSIFGLLEEHFEWLVGAGHLFFPGELAFRALERVSIRFSRVLSRLRSQNGPKIRAIPFIEDKRNCVSEIAV